MILTIDIGNTNIVIGIFKGEELIKHWRFSTSKKKTSDEYGIKVRSLLRTEGIEKEDFRGAVISSVVPSVTESFSMAIRDYLDIEPMVVGPGIKTGLPIKTDNPREVGSDRIVNAVAAYRKHKSALIIVDFGTATTFDYVNEKGEYTGGAIAPGLEISAEALSQRTAKLPRVEIGKPKKIIGKNTFESMQAGLFYGFLSMTNGIIEKIKKEAGGTPKVIATGGIAKIIAVETELINEVDEFLILEGLKIIYEENI